MQLPGTAIQNICGKVSWIITAWNTEKATGDNTKADTTGSVSSTRCLRARNENIHSICI